MFSTSSQFTRPSPAVEKRVNAILKKLSLREKIDLLGGNPSSGTTRGNAAAGLPEFKMADGPVGVHWFTKASTTFPSPIGLAASWNPELARRVGAAIGRDARARGIHILLAPGVNIYRSALCGRNFEYCGEDPYLAAQTAAAYIKGVQSMDVAATVKHYAVNFQEYDRHNISSDLDERTLHEIYLPAFKAAILEAGSGCVMTAYNLVNGVHASEHDYLINKVLKGEWGFKGLVMSDWVSTYSAAGAANGGLDLEMPTAQWLNNEKLLPEVEAGRVKESVIDDKIRRLIRLGICFGWMDNNQELTSIPMDDPETAAVALDAARQSVVLLKNDGILPFDRAKLKKLAVVGPNAHPAMICGGGSAWNPPNHMVSILDGIRRFVGDRVEITYACGPAQNREWRAFEGCVLAAPDGQQGMAAEYYNNKELAGAPVKRCVDKQLNYWWGSAAPVDGVTAEHYSVRWRGSFTPARSGTHVLYAQCGDSGCRVMVNGKTVIDTWEQEAGGTRKAEVEVTAGTAVHLVIEWRKTRHWAHMHFGWEDASDAQREIADAMTAVEGADAVVVCAGFDTRSEGEGFDRSFAMQKDLDSFVAKVAKINKNTVAVLVAGGNVDMNGWIGEVRGLLHAWYPGQEGGIAVAEALFGAINPSGKLPATFEKQLEDRSSFESYHDRDNDKHVTLSDGIFCGYRHVDKKGPAPLFPFGFGLSYTTFKYGNIALSSKTVAGKGTLTVSFDLKNTGKRTGAEVAQLYIRDMKSSLPRPVKELKGFARVELEPGETRRVSIKIGSEALSFYDPTVHGWVAEPGEFEALVGASSKEIKLRARFELKGAGKKRKKK